MNTRTVNIEVYGEDEEVFAVVSEHRPDLPKPFDEKLQEWAAKNFSDLNKGDSIEEAGEMEYEPNGQIIEFRLK